MVLTGIRILWASSKLGILTGRMSCSGGGDSNPGGSRHSCTLGLGCCSLLFGCILRLGSHSSCLGGHAATASASWGLPRSVVSFRVGDASHQSSTGSSNMASRTSSSVNCIRLVMHSQRSLAVPHIIWFDPPDHWSQLCRVLARTRVLSSLVSWMSWEHL